MGLNIAIIQPDILWEDIPANLHAYSATLDRINGSIDVVLLPELFTTGFTMNTVRLAETMQGRSVNWMAEMSRKFKCSITGSLIIKHEDKYYNRLIWMHKDGQYQFYDKRHLFRMGDEEKNYAPGDSIITVKQGPFRIRPLICYDLRFPVWSRNKDDYDILVYVANWPAARHDVWSCLLKARAIENQAFAIGVNRIGRDGMGIGYTGDSLVFDARGKLLASLPKNSPGTLLVSLSVEDLKSYRKEFPVHKDADRFSIGD
jgi:predicted amidohydrolase